MDGAHRPVSTIRTSRGPIAVRESPALSQHESVRALQERINRLTAGLGDETLAAVLPALAEVRRELARELANWTQRHPQDDDAPWTRAKYESLLLQVKTAMEAAKDIAPAMYKGLKTTGRTSGEMAARLLESQVAVYSASFGQPVLLDLDTAAILAEGRSMLVPRFRASAEKYGQDMQDGIKRQLAVGFLKGESWRQMARRLSQLGTDEPQKAHGTADMARGLWRMTMNAAYRVARTEGMNALNAHQQIGLEHWERTEVGAMKLWDGSQDRACVRCRALDGKALPVREQFYDPERGYFDHPTLHPYCRCCLRPHHRDWS